MTARKTPTRTAPPADYPGPPWVEDSNDPYFVPDELRADYADPAAAPTAAQISAYYRGGGVEVFDLRADAPQMTIKIDPDSGRPYPVREWSDGVGPRNVTLVGVEGYPEWAHLVRLRNAQDTAARRTRAAEIRAASAWTCPACREPQATMATHRIVSVLGQQRAVCANCAPLLPAVAAQILTDRDPARTARVRAYLEA